MGTAFTAVADDENALFFNPAGLSETRERFRLTILNPKIQASKDAVNFAQDIVDLETDTTEEITEFLRPLVGDHEHISFDLFPHVLFRAFGAGVGIGILGNASVDADIVNPVVPELETDIRATYGGVISAGYTLLGKMLQVGTGIKILQRQSQIRTFTVDDIALEEGEEFDAIEDLENGTGIGYDAGIILHPAELTILAPAKFLNPAVGLSFQNIGDIDFGDAVKEIGNLAVGIALRPKLWILETTLAFDVNFLNELNTIDPSKLYHFGGEIRFPMVLAVQVGYQHGGVSGGISLDLWIFEIQGATYVEEIDEYAGQDPDRRYSLQLGLLTF
jgi:hypothetical protein